MIMFIQCINPIGRFELYHLPIDGDIEKIARHNPSYLIIGEFK